MGLHSFVTSVLDRGGRHHIPAALSLRIQPSIPTEYGAGEPESRSGLSSARIRRTL